jgi:hypothetical protein
MIISLFVEQLTLSFGWLNPHTKANTRHALSGLELPGSFWKIHKVSLLNLGKNNALG